MSVKMDAKEIAREIALERLKKYKNREAKKKRHTWIGQGLIVTHGSLEGLREMVKDAGFDWTKGVVDPE